MKGVVVFTHVAAYAALRDPLSTLRPSRRCVAAKLRLCVAERNPTATEHAPTAMDHATLNAMKAAGGQPPSQPLSNFWMHQSRASGGRHHTTVS